MTATRARADRVPDQDGNTGVLRIDAVRGEAAAEGRGCVRCQHDPGVSPWGRRTWPSGPAVHEREAQQIKLLLTSGGVTNDSIRDALAGLLGKPIAECHALVVPTAQWGHPLCGPSTVRGLVAAEPDFRHFTGLGWASLGVLELTALPTIGAERWLPWVQAADVLLVDGGDATYLCYWMRESGLAELLPSLPDMVWVGVSAGSMVMTPRIGAYFVEWPQAPDDRTLGVVDFSIFPHLDLFPTNTLAHAERWAADIGLAAYAIDEQTAIKVVDGSVEVVSEGQWTKFG